MTCFEALILLSMACSSQDSAPRRSLSGKPPVASKASESLYLEGRDKEVPHTAELGPITPVAETSR
jgi:hypothetical protein